MESDGWSFLLLELQQNILIITRFDPMNRDKYVQQTLTLPAQMPLFNYNINFEGLKSILEGVNLKTNSNQQNIRKLQQLVNSKLPSASLHQTEKKLNGAFLFGARSLSFIEGQQKKVMRMNRSELKEQSQLDQYCWKMTRLADIVELLLSRNEDYQEKIGNDGKRYQKMIDDSFRRLQEKVNSHIDSFSNTINSYFTQTNKKVEMVDFNLTTFKLNEESKWADLSQDMGKMVSENNLKAHLQAVQLKIKRQLQGVLKADQMLRLGVSNELKQAKMDGQKDLDMKNKTMVLKMQELSQKVAKAMQVNTFEIQKNKIYERLAEMKMRNDDLGKKNGQFVQFRKVYLTNNEKLKSDIRELNDEMEKLNRQQGGSKNGSGSSKANQHLICELQEAIKLHQKEIGTLEKQMLGFEKQMRAGKIQKPKVQISGGHSNDFVQKMIKEYMSNMDFDGRAKRIERDIAQLKKQKKIQLLTKEVNVSSIMKQLDKKCNEENTFKEIRILDGKIEQLFEYYKQLRREVEQKKKVSKTEPMENASLITKKLVSANCISCKPGIGTRRNFSRGKFESSLDYGLQTQKNTVISRFAM